MTTPTIPAPLAGAVDWLREPRRAPLRTAFAGVATIFGLLAVFSPNPPMGVFLNGAIIGGLYGLIAMGLVLIYKADRIISFAQAGLGAFPAVFALNLYLQRGWPYWPCVAIGLAGAVLVGAAVQRLIIRRFSSAPRLILTVATIGVSQLLAYAEIMSPTWIGGEVKPTAAVRTPLSSSTADIGGVVFRGDHLGAVVVVAAAGAALALFLGRTKVGVAIRAVAENRDRARLSGVPVARLGTIVWAVAGLLSGLGVLFRAPLTGLPMGGLMGTQVLLFALAAAVIARMERFTTALIAGCLLGMFDQAAFYATRQGSIATALLLPIVLVALLFQRNQLSRADDSGVSTWQMVRPVRELPRVLRRLPEVVLARRAAVVVGGGLVLAAPYLVDDLRRNDLSQIMLFGVIAVSLVILTGWTGQISLGQFAFTGIGAAVAGGLAAKANADFFVALVVAGLAGAAVSMVIGLPAVRVQGLFLAVTTLAFAASTQAYVLNRDHFGWLLPGIDDAVVRPVLWGVIDLGGDTAFYYACVGLLALAITVAINLRRSRSGRRFMATRDNPRGAQAYGVSLARARLAAFAISGFLAATAGAMYVYLNQAVDPEGFGATRSIDVFAMAIIGGLGSIGGAIAGAVYVVGVKEFLPRYELLATGAGMLVLLMVMPGGLAEIGFRARDALVRLAARRNGLTDELVKWGGGDDAEPGAGPVSPAVRAGGDEEPSMLRCRGVDAGYDGVQVLFGVDLDVHKGEVVALLGTNGAGKSTLLRTVCGLQRATGGSVTLEGRDLVGVDAAEIATIGMGYMPGGRGIFPTLTVEENLRVATWLLGTGADERVADVRRRFPRLTERWEQAAGDLSGGEQQMLSLAMAFVTQPQLLVIDELSLGLAPVIVGNLAEMVREINGAGTTVLIVEQSVNLALTLADRAYFMEKGQVRFSGPTAELLERDDLVRSIMLRGGDERAEHGDGTSMPVLAPLTLAGAPGVDGKRSAPDGPSLELVEVRKRFGGITAVAGATLRLEHGEIVGIIGPNGAGKTTTFDLVSGFLRPDEGEILLLGEDVTDWSPARRACAGLGRLFQDSRLFPSLSVVENLAVAFERHVEVRDDLAAMLALPAARRAELDVSWSVADLLELFDLDVVRHLLAGELSTGTRRVVDLAMAVAHQPSVLLLDEPSSGLAQRETEAMAPMIRRIQEATGAAILVIEHDMGLVTEVSDRMLALEVGVVIAEGPPDEVVRDPRVVGSYLGTDGAVIGRSGPAKGRRPPRARRQRQPVAAGNQGGRNGTT